VDFSLELSVLLVESLGFILSSLVSPEDTGGGGTSEDPEAGGFAGDKGGGAGGVVGVAPEETGGGKALSFELSVLPVKPLVFS
jgi:hypothetical protein